MCTYSEFVEAYNNPNLTSQDIRRVKGLNNNKYGVFRRIALSRGDIPEQREVINRNAKFYIQTENGDYQVQKTIDGHKTIIGRFSDEKTAKEIVNACIDVNWDTSKIKGLIDLKEIKPKNYSKVNGSWVIQKCINRRNIIFNRFSCNKVDEETICEIVDFYRKNDWNLELKSKISEIFDI